MIEDLVLGGFLGAFTGVVFGMFALFGLAVYIYYALALMKIAKKQKVPYSWLAFIPIANVWVVVRTAGLNGWWTAGLLASLIPVIGGIAIAVGFAYAWYLIAQRLKFNPFLGVLMIVPVVNLVIVGIFAWGKGDKK